MEVNTNQTIPSTPTKNPEPSDTNPLTKKKINILFIVVPVIILFLIVIGVLGYLYINLNRKYQNLQKDNNELQTELEKLTEYEQTLNEYENQIATLTSEKDSLISDKDQLTDEKNLLTDENNGLEKEKEALETLVNDYKTKIANIRKYNDFHDYVYYLIATKGFAGFTEAEYQTARAKASATGNKELVAIVDQIWYEHAGNPSEKFAAMMDEVIEGIYDNL